MLRKRERGRKREREEREEIDNRLVVWLYVHVRVYICT